MPATGQKLYMFDGTKTPRNLLQYKLMRGVTDFGQLEQFNMYESGYGFLFVLSGPEFCEKLAQQNQNYANLYENFKHILALEFKGIDGIENITSDTLDITDGISSLNILGKIQQQSASQVTFRFQERSGSPITKFISWYLTGIRDPRTQVKTYHGLVDQGYEPDYSKEIFTLLYINTDNTAKKVENAYLFLAAQPTQAETSIYNSEKGQIEFKEVSVEFNCFTVTGPQINTRAEQVLAKMNTVTQFTSTDGEFMYTGTDLIQPTDDVVQ